MTTLEDIAIAGEKARLLDHIAPRPGSVWHWEPMKSHASTRLRVDRVKWNGEEYIVWATPMGGPIGLHEIGESYPNDLGRWVEATVLVEPALGDA